MNSMIKPLSIQEMLNPAARNLAPSGIRRFFDLAEASKDVISLGVGEPDFHTPERVRTACARALEMGRTHYSPSAGLMELREGIAEYLDSRFAVRYEPSREVLVTVGASEGIDLALRAILSPGDEVLIPVPSYIAYSPVVSLQGGRVVELETRAEDGFKLTADALRDALTPRSKVLIVNFPSNPTGGVMTYEDWLPVAQLVQEHNLLVIADEIYAELSYGPRHVSFASLPGMRERTMLISGFSKAFAMTGWRIGYACGDRDWIAAMLKIHQYTMLCAPILGQIAAVESLKGAMEEMEQMVEVFDQRRRMFIRGLEQIGFSCREPQGAFYAFPSIRFTGLSSEAFAERLLQEGRVAAVPGNVFGSGGEGFIRCSYAASTNQLIQALERMEACLRQL